MENASKALIMAGGILISVMVISLGTYLYTTFRNYSVETEQTIADRQIAQFNSQFYKYYSGENAQDPIVCTAHDIVTVVNLAKENNQRYETEDKVIYERDPNNMYIEVQVVGKGRNFQRKTEKDLTDFIKESTQPQGYDQEGQPVLKQFVCVNVETNNAKRVNLIVFKEL